MMINKTDVLYLNLAVPFCQASSVYQVRAAVPILRDVAEQNIHGEN